MNNQIKDELLVSGNFKHPLKPTWHLFSALMLMLLACQFTSSSWAQSTLPVRLRGTIEAISAQSLTVKERSGEVIQLALPEKSTFQEVLPIDISAIAPNAFIGTAALPGSDGVLRALEVVVFPESARGTGEGHYPWVLAIVLTI